MIGGAMVITLSALAWYRARCNHELDLFTRRARYYNFVYVYFGSVLRHIDYIYRYSLAKTCLRWIKLEYDQSAHSVVFSLLISQSLVNLSLGLAVLLTLIELAAPTAILLMATVSSVLLTVLPFTTLRRNYQTSCYRIERAMPGFSHQLAMLVKSGATVESSINLILARTAPQAALFKILGIVQLERERGNSLADACRVMPELVKLRSVHHFSLLMSQISQTGVHHLSEQLIELGNAILRDRQTVVKTVSEQLSTKLLMPLMISLITIMALLIYPILNQL